MRLGVLTGGGDAPGLNAFLRFLARAAGGDHVLLGFEDSFLGLIEDRSLELTRAATRGLHRMGGTILGATNRGDPFALDGLDRSAEVAATAARHRLDALVVVGGDGTLRLAGKVSQRYGLRIIGVPKTIDGDVAETEATLGFATAVSVATEALDRLEATASSHHRMVALEVMGRSCGRLALHAALAAGADGALLPERPFSTASVLELVEQRRRGARFSVLVVAEGAHPAGETERRRRAHAGGAATPLGGMAEELAGLVERATGVESRAVVLGHVVRGAPPVADDRILAARLAAATLDLARAGSESAVLVLRAGAMRAVPLELVSGGPSIVEADEPVLMAARAVGISFCDEPPAITS